MNEAQRSERRHWWAIEVTGYGSFAFFGTESEAEEMRLHKASWERGTATKQRAEWNDPLVQKQVAWAKQEIKFGYPRSSEREQAETAAIMAADKQIDIEFDDSNCL